jgi:hypothetical protein
MFCIFVICLHNINIIFEISQTLYSFLHFFVFYIYLFVICSFILTFFKHRGWKGPTPPARPARPENPHFSTMRSHSGRAMLPPHATNSVVLTSHLADSDLYTADFSSQRITLGSKGQRFPMNLCRMLGNLKGYSEGRLLKPCWFVLVVMLQVNVLTTTIVTFNFNSAQHCSFLF